MIVRPQPGPQELFLSSPADIVFYGGAAGGGKTWALLYEPLRHITRVKGFGATLFRRTTKQITAVGGVWDESIDLYPLAGGVERQGYLDWRFPPYNNRIAFAHMEYEKSKENYKSAQIACILFDQIEDFSRSMFLYMLSRNRSKCGIRPYIRAAYNPVPEDDPVGGWLHEFVSWYLKPDPDPEQDRAYPDPDRAGIVRWFVNMKGDLYWYESKEEAIAAWPGVMPKSFTFIPASVFDNKILLENDPGYLANLQGLDLIDQERLLKANHKIKPAAGKVINKAWLILTDAIPAEFDAVVRFWDFAATAKKIEAGAATSSVLMGVNDGRYYVLDVTEDWIGPADIDAHVRSLAAQDGRGVAIRWEEEGGATGKIVSYDLVRKLAGYDAAGVRPTGDKLSRGKPFAAQAKAGNVWVYNAPWTARYLTHLHNVPTGGRLDIFDANNGAFNTIAIPAAVSVVVTDDTAVTISPY